jgi:DNA-binding response OmpR family regulator
MIKILVCEDDKLIASIIKQVLYDEGHEVKVVPNGSLAMEELKNSSFHLVISDMIMPVNDGLDVIHFIRNDLKSTVPIIIMSGLSEREHIRNIRDLGASDFISKPFKAKNLKRKAFQLAEHHKLTNGRKLCFAEATQKRCLVTGTF